MTNKSILQIAMQHSAWDTGAQLSDFSESEHVYVDYKVCNKSRKYLKGPICCNLAVEILEHDKVPFYCCAWSNIRSARNDCKTCRCF